MMHRWLCPSSVLVLVPLSHVPQTKAQPFPSPIPADAPVSVPQSCHGTERHQLLVALQGGLPGTAVMRTQLGRGTGRVFLAQSDSSCPLQHTAKGGHFGT